MFFNMLESVLFASRINRTTHTLQVCFSHSRFLIGSGNVFQQLTSILIKVTDSLETIEPIASSLDEQVVKRAQQAASQSRVVGEWMDRMLSQGSQLISLACTIVSNLDVVRTEVDSTIKVFSQELEI